MWLAKVRHGCMPCTWDGCCAERQQVPLRQIPNTPHHVLPPTRMQSWHERGNRSKEMLIACTTINVFALFCPLCPSHLHLTDTKNCSKLTRLRQCNSVRVHLHAYIPHWNVLKHFIHVYFGCGKQSNVVYSLNHDIMALFSLDIHQELHPALAVLLCKTALICLRTSLKGAKIFYTCPLWMCEAIKGGLQPQPGHHGIISTQQSTRISKIWPSFGSATV